MTKKEVAELKAQIEAFLPELQAEIEGAKNDLKNARTLKTQLQNIVTSSNALLENLQDPATGTKAILAKSTEDMEAVSSHAESAQTLLDRIETALANATQHVTEMETAYSSFNDIKTKVDDPETGLNTTLTTIKQVRGRAKEAATKAEATLRTADNTLVQIQKYIATIDKAYASFLDSKKKVDDPVDGLEATLKAMKKLRDNIATVADQSTTLFTQINGYKDEAASSLKDINQNKTSSETTLSDIQQHEIDSEAAKNSIEKLLNIASQESSTAYFKQRTKFVTIVAGVWLVIGVAALVWAVVLGHELVNDVIKKDNISVATVVARALVATPVVTFAFYAFRNYGKERTTAEQYAFKEISGATLEGHVEMASRAFPESNTISKGLEGAVISVIEGLHSEPSELRKTPKNSFKLKSKLMDLEADITDIGDNVEDIKDAVAKPSNPSVAVE